MKDLTLEEYNNAPAEVQHIYALALAKCPVSISQYDKWLEKYPEYFPDELEHKRKWDMIPEHVHDSYWEERDMLWADIFSDLPKSKGILYWMDHPEEERQWLIKYEERKRKFEPRVKNLHEKYYKKYGIDWMDF